MIRTCLLLPAALLFAGVAAAQAPTELRFTVIPDFNKGKLAETCKLVADHLTRKLGMPVSYVPSNDYTMAVNALIANKVDFAWLGGKTTVDAIDAGKGQVRVLATRDIDLDFKTYFIANKKLVDEGKVKKIEKLADLKPVAPTYTFTFGDKNSTSGHLMPRFFLTEAGIDPNKHFKNECGYQASGGHGATLKAVASGAADLGALNFAYWEKASAEDKANAPVIFVTPGYVDYAWVGHQRLGKETMAKITDAFVKLDGKNKDDKAILDAWAAKEKFQAADNKSWDSIRKVRDSLPPGFLQ
ncbi:MAG: phosphate/phosphite/phosphonate ABC transporter substrate-binding protein [Planctomycetota bacterium]